MIVDHQRPALTRCLPQRRENSHHNIGSLGFRSFDGNIFCLTYGLRGPTTRNQRSACSGGFDWLVVHLLVVDDKFVVEFNIFRIELVSDALVYGIRWLRRSRKGIFDRHLMIRARQVITEEDCYLGKRRFSAEVCKYILSKFRIEETATSSDTTLIIFMTMFLVLGGRPSSCVGEADKEALSNG